MLNNPCKPKWTAKGKTINRRGKKTSVNWKADKNIIIEERERSFTMRGYEDAPAAGKPIDADTAILLIKTFYDKLYPYIDAINNRKKDVRFTDEDRIFITDWLVKLLLFSKAMTIDKNILLKTLSQPECEGLRFYLCLKDDKSFSEWERSKFPSSKQKEILSLVTVGIDREGKDLHYDLPKNPSTYDFSKIQMKTTSLASEYGYPPPPRSFIDGEEQLYVLGALAWGDFYKKIKM
jgi:hypothetical protein